MTWETSNWVVEQVKLLSSLNVPPANDDDTGTAVTSVGISSIIPLSGAGSIRGRFVREPAVLRGGIKGKAAFHLRLQARFASVAV
jgi:hypothetical protein